MDKCASLRATKRSSYHEKRIWQSWSHFTAGREIRRDFRFVNKKLLNLEGSLQPLKQGLLRMAAPGVSFCKIKEAQVGIKSLFSRENHFVSLVQTDTSACWGPAQNTAFGLYLSSAIGSSRTARNSQNPVMCSPQGFPDTLLRRALHYIAILTPHFSAREVRHTRILARGHLHLGHACKLGAWTDDKTNLQAMSLMQSRHNHCPPESATLPLQSMWTFAANCEHILDLQS